MSATEKFDRLTRLSETQELSNWQRSELERARRALNGTRRAPDRPWSEAEVNKLCDLISYGYSFSACGLMMGKGKAACVAQFNRIRKNMGWQAQ